MTLPASSWFSLGSAAALPSKTIGLRHGRAAVAGQFGDLPEIIFALCVREPDDLKRMIPFEQAIGVVVDRLARPTEQPGRGVVFAEDQMRVGFAALQGDAHRHLPQRAAGQRIRPRQRLRAEQHVNAKRPPLPHQAIEQQRRVVRDPVVAR